MATIPEGVSYDKSRKTERNSTPGDRSAGAKVALAVVERTAKDLAPFAGDNDQASFAPSDDSLEREYFRVHKEQTPHTTRPSTSRFVEQWSATARFVEEWRRLASLVRMVYPPSLLNSRDTATRNPSPPLRKFRTSNLLTAKAAPETGLFTAFTVHQLVPADEQLIDEPVSRCNSHSSMLSIDASLYSIDHLDDVPEVEASSKVKKVKFFHKLKEGFSPFKSTGKSRSNSANGDKLAAVELKKVTRHTFRVRVVWW
eukprot:7676383-Pyramimonas_sp.AAC.1